MNFEDYTPKMFCFIVPSILGTMITYFGGIPFIILGLVYWLNKSPFARKGAVAISVVSIVLTIAVFIGKAEILYVGFLVLEVLISLVFALVSWIFKVIFPRNSMFNPVAAQRSI